ncbi:uncharacterized protein LOC105923587 isoform X3 [Fundulus heteroclitus]|uniref:uncharacterized protein LOC105923587 isoform X3 n=1 Tax=Fundulus heteroclitus TaxID=8078 RepID=UPI00165B159D|nr:uncharacterized protein LOC105923587 isoform X3 [Fundulus heteroclitus]
MEVAEKILKSFRRTDQGEQMEDSGSRAKRKRFDEEEICRVSAVAALKDLVLKTLTDLKEHEFQKFKWFLQLTQFQKGLPQIPWSVMEFANRAELVNRMWRTCGDRYLQVTHEVLMDMEWSDLVEDLLVESSSFKVEPLVEDFWSELKQEVKDTESVVKLLLEQLADLTFRDVKAIQNILSWDQCNGPYLSISWRLLGMKAGLQETVLLMVQTYSHNPVDKIEELFAKMERPDLVFSLTEYVEKKCFERKRSSALIQKVAIMAVVKKLLLETFSCLNRSEFQVFKKLLQRMVYQERMSEVTGWSVTEIKSKSDLVDVMVEELGPRAVEETRKVFMDMNRTDLLKMLPQTSSGIKEELSPSLDLVDCKSAEQDSCSWTKVDPEEDWTSPDEAPTYRLRSEAGHFECRVSGLRWVCEEKVSFRYRFCSWNGHMLRMEGRGYRPAGPLMDITVFSGKMMEVQLPHWVCIDGVPQLLENFAVLHVNDSGDVLEKVTGVTATHVRIRDPVFSLLAALINYFFPPKITCNTLIYYQPKTPFLKLHIYLIPLDPALKLFSLSSVDKIQEKHLDCLLSSQSIHREETSLGYEVIKKPRPDTPLKMDRVFALKATVETAKIQPPKMTLRHDSQDPNFYEVFIQNPDRNFNLELLQTCSEKVWHCEIRKDDHPKSGSFEAGGAPTEAAAVKTEGEHFVDRHREELIQRVTNIAPILDGLLQRNVILQETYDQILRLQTTQSQMREIFICLRAGDACKDIFFSILQEKEGFVINNLT